MHQSHIPQCTILSQKCAHFCYKMVHCGICEMGLFLSVWIYLRRQKNTFACFIIHQNWDGAGRWTPIPWMTTVCVLHDQYHVWWWLGVERSQAIIIGGIGLVAIIFRLQHPTAYIHWSLSKRTCINSLRPRQNGRHFVEDIYGSSFLNENIWISLKLHWSLFLRVQLTISQHWFR